MSRILLPKSQVLQITRPTVIKPEFHLRLMDPEGLIVAGENRWDNEQQEMFVSLSEWSSKKPVCTLAIACAKSSSERMAELQITAELRFRKEKVEIARVSSYQNPFYRVPPPEITGRGIFGVVLAETAALALSRELNRIEIEPGNKKLRYYYARYQFEGGQKGSLSLSLNGYSLIEQSYG